MRVLEAPPRPVPALRDELDQATIEERRRALRALLAHPMLVADGPHGEDFLLVRRHARELRDWLARNAGWTLQVSSELARLRKYPAANRDGTRPAREPKNKTPFTKRRYVLLCLALAALEGTDRQTALGQLAERIVQLATNDPDLARAGLVFTLEQRDERRDLVQVMRLLLDLHVLSRVDGDEEAFLQERGDVLYNVSRPALAAMLNVRRGPSTIEAMEFEERLAALTEEPLPESDDARHRRRRFYLTRRLLDDPILSYDELDEDELAYAQSQRAFLIERVREWTGLWPEVRREGIAMVDERDELSDLRMPEKGTDGHLTLLLAERLAESARRDAEHGRQPRPVSRTSLEAEAVELANRFKGYWRRGASEPGAERALVAQAIDRLEGLDLVRCDADGVLPRPAIGRFALAEPTVAGEQGTLDLFGGAA